MKTAKLIMVISTLIVLIYFSYLIYLRDKVIYNNKSLNFEKKGKNLIVKTKESNVFIKIGKLEYYGETIRVEILKNNITWFNKNMNSDSVILNINSNSKFIQLSDTLIDIDYIK